MPDFLEKDLAAEADRKGFTGRRKARYVYGAMNNLGAMRGNQVTPKGKRMQAKHDRDVAAGTAQTAAKSRRQPQTAASGRSPSFAEQVRASASAPHPVRNLGRYAHPPRKKG